MSFDTNVFDKTTIDLGEGNYLHFINISSLSQPIVDCINKNIISICEGSSTTDITTLKARLRNYLDSKRGTSLEMGAVAEFFTHLYLNEVGFTQQFMYLNLEEGSIKKGFDGYYTYSNDQWIYESKSGLKSSESVTHESKIAEAYNDIAEKVSGVVSNNPWQNAYNHASHIDVGANQNIRQEIRKLKDEFTLGIYRNIGEFNILPGSTIFLEGNWEDIEALDLKSKLEDLIKTYEYKNIQVICVNHSTVNLFWEYLES
jgi:hypothetical protein